MVFFRSAIVAEYGLLLGSNGSGVIDFDTETGQFVFIINSVATATLGATGVTSVENQQVEVVNDFINTEPAGVLLADLIFETAVNESDEDNAVGNYSSAPEYFTYTVPEESDGAVITGLRYGYLSVNNGAVLFQNYGNQSGSPLSVGIRLFTKSAEGDYTYLTDYITRQGQWFILADGVKSAGSSASVASVNVNIGLTPPIQLAAGDQIGIEYNDDFSSGYNEQKLFVQGYLL